MRKMKIIPSIMTVIILLAAMAVMSVVPAFAGDGNVTYDGTAKQFIFEPGSDKSPTDLFDNFKDVMPGDVIEQTIRVRSEISDRIKVKIYLRSLGAGDPETVDILSQLNLKVRVDDGQEGGYMFDASPDQTAGLTEYDCLGTLYAGGEVDLKVTLEVPATLGDLTPSQAERTHSVIWEFMVEEYPSEPDDPQPPTGDPINTGLWLTFAFTAITLLMILFPFNRRREDEETEGEAK